MSDYHDQGSTYGTEGTASSELSDVQFRLQQLRADLTALANTVAANGSEKAAVYGAKVANDAIEASQNAIQGIRSEFVSLEQNVAARVRARPIQAMGLAIGIGYLFAMTRRH